MNEWVSGEGWSSLITLFLVNHDYDSFATRTHSSLFNPTYSTIPHMHQGILQKIKKKQFYKNFKMPKTQIYKNLITLEVRGE